MTRAVRPRTLRRIASRERQRGYLGLSSYRRLAASALSGPSFAAGLLTSIVPDKAAPGTAPTFTRATTKSFVDWEGVVRTALSGEACFTGARRVQNLLANTAWLGVAPGNGAVIPSWARIGTDITCYTLVAESTPAGATRTISVRETGVGGFQGIGQTFAWTLNQAYCVSARVRVPTGLTPSDCTVYLATATPGNAVFASQAALAAQPKDVWVRYSTLLTVTADTSHFIGFMNSAGALGTGFDICDIQLESVQGQSNQNPGESLVTGLLAAPYQGANFDGVQYFATQNGNTVASNVVTAGTGATIPSSVLLGYSAWQASTNLALQSEDFTTSWTVSNGAITANSVVAPDGATTADKAVPDATNTLHSTQQSVAKAASALSYTVSVHAKAAGYNFLAFRIDASGANGVWAVFDLAGGAVNTAATAAGAGWTGSGATITALGNGWYRCVLTVITSTELSIRAVFCPYSTGAQNPFTPATFAGDAVSGVALWGAQLEQLAFATPYIATTTAIVTRNADNLNFPTSGNVLGATGSCYAEATWASASAVGGPDILDTFPSAIQINFDVTGKIGLYDGASRVPGPTLGSANAVPQKVATRWDGSAGFCNAAGNGVLGTPAAWVAPTIGATMYIGNRQGGGGNVIDGNIRNVKIWNRALADAELVQATSL